MAFICPYGSHSLVFICCTLRQWMKIAQRSDSDVDSGTPAVMTDPVTCFFLRRNWAGSFYGDAGATVLLSTAENTNSGRLLRYAMSACRTTRCFACLCALLLEKVLCCRRAVAVIAGNDGTGAEAPAIYAQYGLLHCWNSLPGADMECGICVGNIDGRPGTYRLFGQIKLAGEQYITAVSRLLITVSLPGRQ